MSGSLIFVSGLSGAGKTTLIRYAVEHRPNLDYLTTVITRPRREGEEDTIEYIFVTGDEYDNMRARYSVSDWDHTEYQGYKYGVDIARAKRKLSKGIDIICAVAPDISIINDMRPLYGVEPLLLWIDTPAEVARKRIAADDSRATRKEDPTVKQYFEYLFTPTGDLETDRVGFLSRVTELLEKY